jgi:hypothetical protein
MMLVSGTIRSRLLSRSTGILPMGQTASNSALAVASARSTIRPSKAVWFSWRASSTFWQKDASGWKYRVSDMPLSSHV